MYLFLYLTVTLLENEGSMCLALYNHKTYYLTFPPDPFIIENDYRTYDKRDKSQDWKCA